MVIVPANGTTDRPVYLRIYFTIVLKKLFGENGGSFIIFIQTNTIGNHNFACRLLAQNKLGHQI